MKIDYSNYSEGKEGQQKGCMEKGETEERQIHEDSQMESFQLV
jgi:hypothetical protein